MAQVVGYFEDDVTFTEGPFVAIPLWGKWRIEVELKGNKCPVILSPGVYKLLHANFPENYGMDSEECCKRVDWLNEQVKKGVITLQNGKWWGVSA